MTTTNKSTEMVSADDTREKVIESLVLRGDLSGLTPAQRASHYRRVCDSLGLNPDSQPLTYLKLNGKEILYASRGATDQLAAIHRVNRKIIDGPKVIDLGGQKIVFCVAEASHPNGRTETAIATIQMSDPANVLMKAETKAKRRATLSILGLGMLDEMEVESIPAEVKQPGGSVDLSLAPLGIEVQRPTLPAPSSWPADLAACTTLADVRAAYAASVTPDTSSAMRDDVRAWLAERGIPGVTGAEASALLSTMPEDACRVLSELWLDEEREASERCVTAARAVKTAQWDAHSTKTAHTVVVRCYAHTTGADSLRGAADALVAARDAVEEAHALEVPADVRERIASKTTRPALVNSIRAHAAEVLANPTLAGLYAAQWVKVNAAPNDPRPDADKHSDALARVLDVATKATEGSAE
jgi:hypothetical protein